MFPVLRFYFLLRLNLAILNGALLVDELIDLVGGLAIFLLLLQVFDYLLLLNHPFPVVFGHEIQELLNLGFVPIALTHLRRLEILGLLEDILGVEGVTRVTGLSQVGRRSA